MNDIVGANVMDTEDWMAGEYQKEIAALKGEIEQLRVDLGLKHQAWVTAEIELLRMQADKAAISETAALYLHQVTDLKATIKQIEHYYEQQ